MDSDDKQIGRILSRREVLALLGTAGAGMLAVRAAAQSGSPARTAQGIPAGSLGGSIALPACVVRPAQTEGPYFVDEMLNRSDIRVDPSTGAASDGALLEFAVRVSRVGNGSCAPLAGAMVDIWQCDALGVYSDVKDMNGFFDTKGQKFLRGFQRTDASGMARFATIYPGWYQGRTTHIHFKVRVDGAGASAREFTSQLYFDDSQSDEVFARAPYATNKQRRVRNSGDGIFRSGGRDLLLAVEKKGAGYAGTFDLGLELG